MKTKLFITWLMGCHLVVARDVWSNVAENASHEVGSARSEELYTPEIELGGQLKVENKELSQAKLFSVFLEKLKKGEISKLAVARGFFDQRRYVRYLAVRYLEYLSNNLENADKSINGSSLKSLVANYSDIKDPFVDSSNWQPAENCKAAIMIIMK